MRGVSAKNVIPRMSKGSLKTHAKFFSGSSIFFENRLLPNHTAIQAITMDFIPTEHFKNL